MKKSYPKLADKQWLASQVQNKPLRQIAEEVGCSYAGVLYSVRKHGIEVPHRFTHRFSPQKSDNIKKALRERYPNGRFGDKASNWRGGRHSKSHGGYIRVYAPNHPNSQKGSVFEHTLIAEKKIGRYITKDEIVHHTNGDKSDNRPENLEVMLRSEHAHKHFTSGDNIQNLLKYTKYLEQLLVDNSIEFDRL